MGNQENQEALVNVALLRKSIEVYSKGCVFKAKKCGIEITVF